VGCADSSWKLPQTGTSTAAASAPDAAVSFVPQGGRVLEGVDVSLFGQVGTWRNRRKTSARGGMYGLRREWHSSLVVRAALALGRVGSPLPQPGARSVARLPLVALQLSFSPVAVRKPNPLEPLFRRPGRIFHGTAMAIGTPERMASVGRGRRSVGRGGRSIREVFHHVGQWPRSCRLSRSTVGNTSHE